MENFVNHVTKKGKPSAMAIKRFETEINWRAEEKIREVKTKLPLKSDSERDIIISGGGKLRSAAEIRLFAKTKQNYSNGLYFQYIFDTDKEMEIIKRENEEISEKRAKIISEIMEDVRFTINSVYFGESNLSELLKEFGSKRYI